MDTPLAKLTSQVYQLEGLLLVLDKHESDTPQVVIDGIRETAAEINRLAQSIEAPEPEIEPEPIEEPEPEAEPEPEPELPPLPDDLDEPEDEPEEEEVEEEIEEEPEEEFEEEPEEDEEPLDEDEEEEEEPSDTEGLPEPSQAPVTVDVQLQRNLSKNLRSAFSLNDRFRFRRELFGNSDLDMNDALDMILTMHSYDEATDYFYNELGWDSDNPDVADFMTIVHNYFA